MISGTDVGNADQQLGARPEGPGRLFLCLSGGSEVFRVNADERVVSVTRLAEVAEQNGNGVAGGTEAEADG